MGRYVGIDLPRLAGVSRPVLPGAFRTSAPIFGGEVQWRGGRDGRVRIVVSVTGSDRRFACADLNGDGRFVSQECAFFGPATREGATEPEAWFHVPARDAAIGSVPLVIYWFDSVSNTDAGSDHREIGASISAIARGTVDLAGRPTLVALGIDVAGRSLVDPRNGYVAIDGNGDGEFDSESGVMESTTARNEDVVFRVGLHHVSFKAVDRASGEVLLDERPASDYLYIERTVGATVPDFSFTDFEGRTHRLSDYRGKFVLLDFWYSSCAPCAAEVPFLKAAYEQLHERGLEIIGIDVEKQDTPEARAEATREAQELVKARGITWPQGTGEEARTLADRRFRISAFPTTLLIGPDGRVVSTGANRSLRSQFLLPTLERSMANGTR